MKFNKLFLLIIIFSFLGKNAFSAFDVNARTAIIQDHLSGKILYEKNADDEIYPASMTKIMTTIVVFDLLKKGETSLDEKIVVSEKSWRMSQSGYSSMFIMLNDKISVENLLKGIIIASGNDACVALAEGLAGSEKDFVELMNEKAEEIGLENTNFANSSGISHHENYSTVRDILFMSKYLIENYPEYYLYFKETSFTWDRTGGDPITQGNRNPLLYKNIGVDGIKTGYLAVEKYSLAASLSTGKRRITAVGSGFDSKNLRSRETAKMLNWAIRKFDTIQVTSKDKNFMNMDVWLGKKNKLETVVNEDIYFTVPKRKKSSINPVVEFNSPIKAPILKGDKVGKLSIYIDGELKKEADILSNENIKRANIFYRLLKSLNYLVWGDV